MKLQNNKLIIRQLDRKLQPVQPLKTLVQPSEGWIKLIRKTLNMSLRQLGNKLSITPPSVRDIELREQEGTVTLKTLREAADALDMKLVYAFVPKDTSLEKMIERKAHDMAVGIVQRTSLTMKLEDQENSQERLQQAVNELTEQLQRELPKSLWD
jgi:predicted DNA-binding mobile mystery protein A